MNCIAPAYDMMRRASLCGCVDVLNGSRTRRRCLSYS